LAAIWKFGSPFPGNLKWAALGAWLMLPVSLFAAQRVFHRFGFPRWECGLLTVAMGTNPLMCLWSTQAMSDLLFLSLFLACLSLAERSLDSRESAWLAFIAGLIAGVAYLTRTAALPLAVTAPLCFLMRKQWQRGLLFLAAALPPLASWQIWTSAHVTPTRDPALLYYTSYLGLQFTTVHLDNLVRVLWVNLDALVRSLAGLIIFHYQPWKYAWFEYLLAAGSISGAVRLVRRSGQIQYPAAAFGIAVMLLAFHYPPDERLAMPLYPLVLMGLLTEIKSLCEKLAAAWGRGKLSERLLTAVMGAAVAAVPILAFESYFAGDAIALPRRYAIAASTLATHQPAYDWLRAHTPPEATIYAYDDALLYLHTGRRALGLTMPYARAYDADPEADAASFLRALPQNACRHGLDYLLITADDFYREGHTGQLFEIAARDHRLQREFLADKTAVYRCPTIN
jgi:hypothetical protein